MPFNKFPSLEAFGQVWRNQSALINGPVIEYGSKIKLHGTNAAIRCEGGEVFAQKRTSDVTVEEDNAGFARWLEPHKASWVLDPEQPPVTYFGEWAGPGVQKGDSVSQLDEKYFFIFAIKVGDTMLVDPEDIEGLLPDDVDSPTLDNVLVLPWHTKITIDFSDPVGVDAQMIKLSEMAEEIGDVDPFILKTFEMEGPGEGMVFVPLSGGTLEHFASFAFKVKATRHTVKQKTRPASRDIVVPAGVAEFVEMFVTPNRCEQALTEACGDVADRSNIPNFLKWLGGDVKKESVHEMADAALEWKDVSGAVTKAAVAWFNQKSSQITAVAA
jgi:hypothetical protein